MHDLQRFPCAFPPIDLDFWPNASKDLEELLSAEETWDEHLIGGFGFHKHMNTWVGIVNYR